MAYLARTLASVGRGMVRRVATQQTITPTSTNTTPVVCNRFLTTYMRNTHQHTPLAAPLTHQHKRQQHTKEGDRDLAAFLAEEIEHELREEPAVPKLDNFRMSREGTVVTLTQRQGNEKITVTFDVNKSVNVPTDAEMGDDLDGGIVSFPEFQVSIAKPSGRTLTFNCNTDEGGMDEDDEGGEMEENFRVDSVQAYTAQKGLDTASVYEAEAENMDTKLHDMLFDTLAERGIDKEFVDGLIDLSTAVEHRLYVEHLKAMKDFASEKS